MSPPGGKDLARVTSSEEVLCYEDDSETEGQSIYACQNVTQIYIRANNGVAASQAFHAFLKEHCNSHISWEYSRVDIPEVFPSPINFVLSSADRFRYMDNVCTFGYTYVFWDWPRWVRHIDWMALNGINLPLAFIGQEAIWQRVWKQVKNQTRLRALQQEEEEMHTPTLKLLLKFSLI